MRESQSVNSSSPGAEAVELAESPRVRGGLSEPRGLAKAGDELRTGRLPLLMEEATDEDCREWRLYEEESSERSREDRERLGLGWRSMDGASESTGSGSWNRTVRLGLPVEPDFMDD